MALLRLATRTDEVTDATPALTALTALRQEIADLQAQDASWAQMESDELSHIRAYEANQTALAALEERFTDAVADQKVLGSTDVDLPALEKEIAVERTKVAALEKVAKQARANIKRIVEKKRAPLREQSVVLNQQFRSKQHAARSERLASAMEGLLLAEAAYLVALQTAFGIAASIDLLAKAPGVQLAFAGALDVQDLVLPRPHHPHYADRPSPQRPDIAAAITAECERVSKEL